MTDVSFELTFLDMVFFVHYVRLVCSFILLYLLYFLLPHVW